MNIETCITERCHEGLNADRPATAIINHQYLSAARYVKLLLLSSFALSICSSWFQTQHRPLSTTNHPINKISPIFSLGLQKSLAGVQKCRR